MKRRLIGVHTGPFLALAALVISCGHGGEADKPQAWLTAQLIFSDPPCVRGSIHAPFTIHPDPKIAVDTAGNAFMAWIHCSGQTDVGNVWVSQFARATGSWSSPEAIGSRNDDSRPDIAIGPTGAVIVVWSAGGSIWAKTYQPTRGWGVTERVAVGSVSYVRFDRDGGALVVWIDFASRYTLGARRLSETGWQAPQLVELRRSLDTFRAAIGQGGDACFVWTEAEPGSRGDTLWALRFEAAHGWGPIEPLPGAAPIRSFGAPVGVDRDGNALVVWQRGGPNGAGPVRIWSNRFSVGQGWGEAMPVENGLPEQRLRANSDSPSLVVNANGDAITAWPQNSGDSVWANRYLVRTGWEQVRQIDPIADYPLVALDERGNGMVVWSVLDQYSSPAGLSGKRIVAGRGWEAAAPPVRTGAWRPVPMYLTADGSGGFFLVWNEQPGDLSIWASRFTQLPR